MKRNKLFLIILIAAIATAFSQPYLYAAETAGVAAPAETAAPQAAEQKASVPEAGTAVKPTDTTVTEEKTTAPAESEKKAATIDDLVKAKIAEKQAADAEKGKPARCLVRPQNLHITGYFAPLVRLGERNGHFAAYAGAKGGVMLNDLVIGAAYSIFTDYTPAVVNTHNHKILTQFGGMLIEYNFFRKYIVNFSVGTIVGVGTSGYVYKDYYDENDEYHDYYDYENKYKGTYYFYLEPEIVLYVNVARFCRVGIGTSYRYTHGLDKYGLTDKTFDGFHGLVVCQFGWF